jgi:hypothetical protein
MGPTAISRLRIATTATSSQQTVPNRPNIIVNLYELALTTLKKHLMLLLSYVCLLCTLILHIACALNHRIQLQVDPAETHAPFPSHLSVTFGGVCGFHERR